MRAVATGVFTIGMELHSNYKKHGRTRLRTIYIWQKKIPDVHASGKGREQLVILIGHALHVS